MSYRKDLTEPGYLVEGVFVMLFYKLKSTQDFILYAKNFFPPPSPISHTYPGFYEFEIAYSRPGWEKNVEFGELLLWNFWYQEGNFDIYKEIVCLLLFACFFVFKKHLKCCNFRGRLPFQRRITFSALLKIDSHTQRHDFNFDPPPSIYSFNKKLMNFSSSSSSTYPRIANTK